MPPNPYLLAHMTRVFPHVLWCIEKPAVAETSHVWRQTKRYSLIMTNTVMLNNNQEIMQSFHACSMPWIVQRHFKHYISFKLNPFNTCILLPMFIIVSPYFLSTFENMKWLPPHAFHGDQGTLNISALWCLTDSRNGCGCHRLFYIWWLCHVWQKASILVRLTIIMHAYHKTLKYPMIHK